MNRTLPTAAILISALASATSFAVPKELEKPSGRHILFVNVDEAMPAGAFGAAVSKVAGELPYPIWTNATGKAAIAATLSDASAIDIAYGTNVAYAVFAVRDDKSPAIISVPDCLAIVNVAPLEKDEPTAVALALRQAKSLFRGLAYACGSGATMEQNCLLRRGLKTNADLDAAPFAISPMAYLPMLETLDAAIGDQLPEEE